MIDAVTGRLDGLTVYLVDVPTNPGDAYVVLYPATGLLTSHGYAASPTDQSDEFRAMCVSNSAAGVTRLLDRVRGRLTGWCPFPDDPSHSPLYETDAGPVLTTRVEGRTLHSLTLVYRAHRRRKKTP